MSSQSLVDAVVTASGGLERFNKVESIEIDLVVSGWLFHLKGQPGPNGHKRLSIGSSQRLRKSLSSISTAKKTAYGGDGLQT